MGLAPPAPRRSLTIWRLPATPLLLASLRVVFFSEPQATNSAQLWSNVSDPLKSLPPLQSSEHGLESGGGGRPRRSGIGLYWWRVDAKEMLYVLFEDCLLCKKISGYQASLVCSLLINSSPAENMQ